MTKRKTGLVIFWIAIIWAILSGVIGSVIVDSSFRTLTKEELSQTMWSLEGPWYLIWAFGVPVAALVALIGIFLHTGVKGSKAWIYGIGSFIVVTGAMFLGSLGHIPLLFGIGGTLILLCFIGIVRFWAKERTDLTDVAAAAADLKLVGYVFMVIAAWFICGLASIPFLKALEGMDPSSPIHIMVFLVLGWLFLFLSHHKASKQ